MVCAGAVRYPGVVLIVTGSIEARPETIERILELGLAHVRRSRQEPGCLLHSMHRDVEDQFRVVFVEQWEDAEALDAHFHLPAAGEFVREISSLARRPPEMLILEGNVISIQDVARQKR
jgi:quinol monooxygenase YgiN